MLVVLSPAKRLNEKPVDVCERLQCTAPAFVDKACVLLDVLKKYDAKGLQSLMGISDKLAQINYERFQQMKIPANGQGKPAVFLFNGEAFQGLAAHTLTLEELQRLQQHLRILSGLYGVLRPLDIIMPYRLEMGTSLQFDGYADLYAFWKDTLTDFINSEIEKANYSALINLASQEYFNALDPGKIRVPIYHIHFREYLNGKYKFMAFYGKKARGLMTRFIVKNNLQTPEELVHFDLEGYHFHPEMSDTYNFYFTRGDD